MKNIFSQNKFAVGLILFLIFLFAAMIAARAAIMGKNLADTLFITIAFVFSQSFTRIRWFQRKMNPRLKELTLRDIEGHLNSLFK